MHKLNSGPTARDGAYHQGTVWSWLLGPFITAYVGVNGRSEEARRQAQTRLSPLESHLVEAGLGHVSEIFEGDAPHRPCGCIAQAWSVAEILRVHFEDVRGLRPNTRPSGRPTQSKNRAVTQGLPRPERLPRHGC
jgi:glycogen debranching enzyme